jgi:NAD-dependent SIR2 family protein deacetylase
MKCNAEYSQEYFRDKIFNMTDGKTDADGNIIPWCLCDQPDCGGNVKPDIVYFGESLPRSFAESREVDLPQADLLLVLGTSLQVYPFAATKDYCSSNAPRLLVNLEVRSYNSSCILRRIMLHAL